MEGCSCRGSLTEEVAREIAAELERRAQEGTLAEMPSE